MNKAVPEVIDLVNLRFMSEYHGLGPDVIIGMRGRHKSFLGIHDEIGRGRAKGGQRQEPKMAPWPRTA